MAIASVTGEVLGTPNAKMKEQLGKGGLKLFTPRRSTSRVAATSTRRDLPGMHLAKTQSSNVAQVIRENGRHFPIPCRCRNIRDQTVRC